MERAQSADRSLPLVHTSKIGRGGYTSAVTRETAMREAAVQNRERIKS